MQNSTAPSNITKYIHTVIGLSLMIFFRYVPAPVLKIPDQTLKDLIRAGIPVENGFFTLSVTPEGMAALGIFFGTIYLWGLVDTVWPSFLGVLMVAMTTAIPMPLVLSKFFGNPMVVMIFFLFLFAGMIVHANIAAYLARWFLTHRLTVGRPWMLTTAILVGTYCVAWLEQVTACLLMWSAAYVIFEYAGLKKGNKYVSLMIVNILIMALLSFGTDAIKGGAFYLVANLQGLADAGYAGAFELNLAKYILFGLIISIAVTCVLLFLMRYVFRVDVSPLARITPEVLNRDPLPPFNMSQKILVGLFCFLALWLVLPGIIGKTNPLGAFMAANALGGTMLIVFLAVAIRVDGKPVATLETAGSVYQWRTFFLIATAFFLGGNMTAPNTHVNLFMKYFLQSTLEGIGFVPMAILVTLMGIVITNFFNSVVAGIVVTPVILALCTALDFSAGPIMACFFFAVLIAAATPAASPFAAMAYDNPEWIDTKTVAIHTVLASLVVVSVLVVVGLPLATLLF